MDSPSSRTTLCLRSVVVVLSVCVSCPHLPSYKLFSFFFFTFFQILQLLQWLDRFWDVCSLLSADSQGVSVLSLHWQWVQKHVILRLPQLLLGDGCATFEYVNTLENI